MPTVARRIGGTKLSVLCVSILLLAGTSSLGRENAASDRSREFHVVFDSNAIARLPTTVNRGLFLTKARIGNREAGPFMIDSGAAPLALDVELAKALNLSLWSGEKDPETKQTVEYGWLASFQVGPMTLRNVTVAVSDLGAMRMGLDERLAGVLGFPFFEKAVIEVDYSTGSVSCFDPKGYTLPRGEWQPLTLMDYRPTLTARLEGDIEGLFVLDTGSTGTALFHPDFVQKHALSEHRSFRRVKRYSWSGESEVLQAKIAWFELAGHRFEEPTVRFELPNTPRTKLAGLAGIIGQGFLREFTVVFNYPESKIALLRK
ncbi:MAG: aspartyl protease family protein [Candidatus Methylomirabilota bacterium]